MGRIRGGRGVEPLATCIRIKFYIDGKPYRETIDRPPSPANLKYAERLKHEIDAKVAHGIFNYAEYFPKSPNLKKLGISAGRATFEEYAKIWQDTYAGLSKGTRTQYNRYLKSVWIPAFGSEYIDEIKPSKLAAFVAQRDWGSVKNMNNHLTALRGPFALAVRDRVIKADHNPTIGIDNKPYQPPGADPFTLDEANTILNKMGELYPEQLVNYFEVAFFTGVRPEEEIALRWSDIDWSKEIIRIDKAISYGEEKGTKTGKPREIEANSRALAALERQKKFTLAQGDFVFVCPRTKRPYPSNQQLRDVYWRKTIEETAVRYRDMYQTRHTFATLNLMEGANPAWLAKQLGHSIQMLLKVYTKWIDGADRGREKAKLEARLKQSVESKKCTIE